MKKILILLLVLISCEANAKSYKLGNGFEGNIGAAKSALAKCISDSDCEDGSYCYIETHTCKKNEDTICNKDSQCASGYYCGRGGKCTELKNKCTTSNYEIKGDHEIDCYDCRDDSQCSGPKNRCDTSSRTCVECTQNSDCEGTFGLVDPYCDLTYNTCKSTTCEAEHCNNCLTGQSTVCAPDSCEDGYVEINGVCEKCSDHTTVIGGTCTGACTKISGVVSCYKDGITCTAAYYVPNDDGTQCVAPTCKTGEILTASFGCYNPCNSVRYSGSPNGGTWSPVGTECIYTAKSTAWNQDPFYAREASFAELDNLRSLSDLSLQATELVDESVYQRILN